MRWKQTFETTSHQRKCPHAEFELLSKNLRTSAKANYDFTKEQKRTITLKFQSKNTKRPINSNVFINYI